MALRSFRHHVWLFVFFALVHHSVAILNNSPRLRVEDGNLVLESAPGKNVSLRAQNSGYVVINGIDVSRSYALINSVRPQLETLNTSSLGFLIRNLSQVVQNVASETKLAQSLEDMQTTIGDSATKLSNLQSSYVKVQSQIQTLEQNVSNVYSMVMTPEQRSLIRNLTHSVDALKNGPTSSASFQDLKQKIILLQSQVSDLALLEERVDQLETSAILTNGSSGGGSGSSASMRSLTRKVYNLQRSVRRLRSRVYTDNCRSSPCHHGGTCIDTTTSLGYFCLCPKGFEGATCNQDVNECIEYIGTDLACQNGATCMNTIGSYTCTCVPGWYGVHCTDQGNGCKSQSGAELCGHGTCIPTERNGQPYQCLCDQGWTNSPTNPACIVDVDECASNKPPCSHDPQVMCINQYGSFTCGPCPTGYTGNGFACRDIDECAINNGGCSMYPMVECINKRPGRVCGPCPPGYTGNGMTCSPVARPCLSNPCHALATCQDNPMMSSSYYTCVCPAGYIGNGFGPAGCIPSSPGGNTNPCLSNPCLYGQCTQYNGQFVCTCNAGYTGPTCATPVNPCASSPCLNGGTCSSNLMTFSCLCPSSYTGNRCQTVNRRCGGFLRGEGGVVTYPLGDQLVYDHNISCAWVISVNRTQVVNVTFHEFHLEQGGSEDCIHDWLQIHDGRRSSNQLIGRYCHQNTPGVNGTVISTHNYLYLWFRSDHSVAKSGFNFTWKAIDPVCGGAITDQEHGSINSPGYPGRYPANRDCYWTVKVSPGKKIQFAFATLQIEHHDNCSFDYLSIRDGLSEDGHILSKYCSTQLPSPLTSSGSEALLHFHSDHSESDTGFHITFVSIPGIIGCGGLLTNDVGEIFSPTISGQYHHGLNCEWVIRIQPGETIELNFTSFHMEHNRICRFDYVEVRDGPNSDSPLFGKFCGYTIPEPISSSTNQMYIKFVSDSSMTGEGFRARYQVVCGGLYTEETGVLKSPFHPQNYPHERVCEYVIRAPVGKVIILNFTSFELERHFFSCIFDYLEIHDGLNSNYDMIGRYCSPIKMPPNLITSKLNALYLRFKTDGSQSNRGFSAYYTTVDIECGGIHHKLTGTISYPTNQENYPSNADCRWIINVPPGFIIQLTWNTFVLEGDGMFCNYDYVQVFDNSSIVSSNGEPFGKKYCGSKIPKLMTSHENLMTIHFHSDYIQNHDGFSLSYHALNATRYCGGNFHTRSGRIRSPNYPNKYPSGRTCVWTITAPVNHQIKLNFTHFDVEGSYSDSHYDYLEIRNGLTATSPLVEKLHGRNKTVPNVISHGHQLYLKFKSDNYAEYTGFELFWEEASSGCGGTMTSPSGEFMSPGYPEPSGVLLSCVWTIRVNRGSQIIILFTDIDTGNPNNCKYNFVEVRDGPHKNSPSLGKYCHNQGIISFNSSGHEIRVRYHGGWNGRGFRARYHSNCNTVLRGQQGIIESPGFPFKYPNSRNCTWTIKAPLGNGINVSFSHFDVEGTRRGFANCTWDFVEVRAGQQRPRNAPKIVEGHFCGTDTPPELISTAIGKDVMEIQFVSDFVVPENGFRLEWKVHGCGGILQNSHGRFQSPNYPNAYPANTECEWHIIAWPGLKIQITIEEFDIESSFQNSTCTFDALKIYGGTDKTSPVLLTLCHHEKNAKTVTTMGSNAVVSLVSDASVRGRGFKAQYHFVLHGCGGRRSVTSTKSHLNSPSYPNNYNDHTDCIWLLQANLNHVVELEFTDFDVEQGTNCTYDYVAIYDGFEDDAPMLSQHCGNSLPSPPVIRSSGNKMLVRMKADGSHTGKGFAADIRQGCGATIDIKPGSPIGFITSPSYPAMITPKTVCHWHLMAPEGSRIHYQFTHMNIRDPHNVLVTMNDNCSFNYVKILDGDSSSQEIGRHCGTRLPGSKISSGQELTIDLRTKMVEGTGFRIQYSILETTCGAEIYSETGEFASPKYPLSYPRSSECTWTIHAGLGNKIRMNFEDFDIEENDGCNLDYLEVHERNQAGQLLLHNCSSTQPESITVNDALWVKFKTDDTGTARGFLANFALLHRNELYENEGQISSPLYPHIYTTTTTYEWLVQVPSGQFRPSFISFKIMDMSIELDAVHDICYSSLVIHDGPTEDSYILKTLCGYTSPEQEIVTSSNVALIRFVSRFRHEGSLFKLRYVTVNQRPSTNNPVQPVPDAAHLNCSYRVNLRVNTSATIKSKNYPSRYEPNMNCEWIFETNKHSSIDFSISHNIEGYRRYCIHDMIDIYDGYEGTLQWKKKKRLCGRGYSYFLSSGRFVRLTFVSDNSVERKGFRIRAGRVCGGLLTDPDGVIYTDGYPNDLDSYQHCTWRIKLKPGRKIQIKFDYFKIANKTDHCNDAFLLIYNGDSTSSPFLGQGRYCGRSITPTVPETSSNMALLIFKTTYDVASRFHLTYREISAGCGGTHHITAEMPKIEITSPNYPNPPHPHTECEWILTSPPMRSISWHFVGKYDVGSQYDGDCIDAVVEIRDGGSKLSPIISRSCGPNIPNPVRSSSSTMYIRYFTNADHVHSGFKAEAHIAKCGGTYRLSGQGFLSSRNYPNPYDSELNCTYHVLGPIGHYMTLIFQEVNIYNPRTTNCSMEHGRLTAFDPVTNNSVTYCDEGVSHPAFETASSNLTLTFTNTKPDGDINRFKLLFIVSQDVCGGTFTGSGGVIQSPGYPHGIGHTRRCIWKLRGPPGTKISLTFDEISIDEENRCSIFLSIYNGVPHYSNIINTIACYSSTNRTTFNSSMNEMSLRLEVYQPSQNAGFKATWTSEYEQDCGGTLTEPEGTIASPDLHSNRTFEDPINCVWTVNNPSPANNSMEFFIDVSNLSRHCGSYVSLKAYGSSGEVTWEKGICNDAKETNFVFSYPTIKIIYKRLSYASSDSGFNMTYKPSICGGYRTGPQDIIESPGFQDGQYPPNTECAWIFSYSEGSQIEYEFTDFQLEDSLHHDFVKVFNGEAEDSPMIGQYTGSGPSNRNIGPSMSNKLLTIFKSDPTTNKKGFRATAREHTAGCGGIFHGINDTISSPGFENGTEYPSNSECIWTIKAPPGYQLTLTFIEAFDVEKTDDCQNDFVQASLQTYTDGEPAWTEEPKRCGKQIPDQVVVRSTTAKVKFRSNEAVQGRGFKIRYLAVCGGNFEGREGIIMSPNHANDYPKNAECVYEIAAGAHSIVTLNFTSFDIYKPRYFFRRRWQSCHRDSLKVMRKTSNRYRLPDYTLCGSDRPDPIAIQGPVKLVFKSGRYRYRTHVGFALKYSIKECGGNLTEPGIIELHTHQGSYLNEMRCIWDIKAPEGKVVLMKFQKLVLEGGYNCRYDYVKIYDGFTESDDKLIQQICGNHTLQLPIINTGVVTSRLVFESDTSFARDGFKVAVDFTYKCGGVINITQVSSTESIRSLDFDNDGNYENMLHCKWVIIGHPDMLVALNFTRLDIEGPTANDTEKCPYDSVKIYDGLSESSTLDSVYCGSTMPTRTVVGLKNELMVLFQSDSVNVSAGFTATVYNKERLCGSISLTATNVSQTLQSPNYPAHYPVSVSCLWIIRAPEGKRINIHINEFKLEFSQKCTKDQLEFTDYEAENNWNRTIQNGITSSSQSGYPFRVGGALAYFTYGYRLNHLLCGHQQETTLISSNNKIQLTFKSDQDTNDSGFKIHYKIQSCNATYRGASGRIRGSNENGAECRIKIKVESGKFIALNIKHYYSYHWGDQSQKMLMVYNGATTSSPVLLELSAPTYYKTAYSTGDSLLIVMNGTSFGYNMYYSTSNTANGCGGRFFGTNNRLYSPSYPQPPGQNLTCLYTVAVPHNYHAILNSLYFDMGDADCNSTYIELFNVLPSNEPSLVSKFCAKDSVARHLSPTNRLILKFVSGPEPVNGTGWQAKIVSGTPHQNTVFNDDGTVENEET